MSQNTAENKNVAALVYDPDGKGNSSVELTKGTFHCASGNGSQNGGNVAVAIVGPGKVSAKNTKVSIGNGAVRNSTAEAEEESELKSELSNVLTFSSEKLDEVVEELQNLGIYKPKDLLLADIDDLKKIVKGVQFTRLNGYMETLKQEVPQLLDAPTDNPTGKGIIRIKNRS